METILENGFYETSGMPSIVSGPVIKGSTKKRFSVPNGIDDKVISHQEAKKVKEQEAIQNAFKETVLQWHGLHVPANMIQKRIDAFKVRADDVHSVADVFKVFKAITDKDDK